MKIDVHTALTIGLALIVLMQNGRKIVEAIAWAVEKVGRR